METATVHTGFRNEMEKLVGDLNPEEKTTLLRVLVDNMYGQNPNNPETVMDILSEKMLSLTGTDVRERGRETKRVWRRALFIDAARDKGITLSRIGSYLGMSHSTVLHQQRKIKTALALPAAFKDIVEEYNKYHILIESAK